MQLVRGNKKVSTYVDFYRKDWKGNSCVRFRLLIPYRIAHALSLTARKMIISTEDVIISHLVSSESEFHATPHNCPGMYVKLVHQEKMPVQLIVRRGVWKEHGFE